MSAIKIPMTATSGAAMRAVDLIKCEWFDRFEASGNGGVENIEYSTSNIEC